MIQTTFCGNFWWLFNAKSGLHVWNVDVFACFPFFWWKNNWLLLTCFSGFGLLQQISPKSNPLGLAACQSCKEYPTRRNTYGLLMFGWPQSSWWKTSIIFCSFWWFFFIAFLNFTLLPHYLSLFGDLIKSSGYCNPLLGDWNQFLPMKLYNQFEMIPVSEPDLAASFLMAFDH